MSIGILLFETAGSRLKGDPGFPGTFDFPVEYGVVKGSYRDLIAGSGDTMERLTETARALEEKGVSAIAGDCGLMALYQRELALAVHIPVLSSSLVLLPLIRALISGEQAIGILTGHSEILGKHHLEGAGAGKLDRLVIQGMQGEPHFHKVVIQGEGKAQYNLMKRDVFRGIEKLEESCRMRYRDLSGLGAVLLECSNLAVFAEDAAAEFHIPVFSINSGIRLLHGVLEEGK